MKHFLRQALIACLCVAFTALVSVLVAGMRFGLPDYYFVRTIWIYLASLGGAASVFAALLAPGWRWQARVLLLLGGSVASLGVAWGIGQLLTEESTTLEILGIFTVWGGLLGWWLGWLHGTPWRGLTAALLLLGSLTGLGLFLAHPDPALLCGIAAGLLAATLFARSEGRSRLLTATRRLTLLLYLVVAGTLVALMPRHWTPTPEYDLTRRNSSYNRTHVCVSPDGQRVITADNWAGAYLWTLDDGQVVQRRRLGDVCGAVVVRFPANDKAYSLFLNRYGLLTRWNAHTDEIVSCYIDGLPRHYKHDVARLTPFLLALSPDGRRGAVVDVREDRLLWIVELDEGRTKDFAVPTALPVTALAWIDHDRILLGCGGDGSVHEVRIGADRLDKQRSFNTPLDRMGEMMVSPDRQRFCLFGLGKSPPVLIRFEDGATSRVSGPAARSRVVRFSKYGGAHLYWVRPDDGVHVWDVSQEREVRCYRQHHTLVGKLFQIRSRHVAGLAICPDEKRAVSADGNGKVGVWELDHE